MILDLYRARSESAINETAKKYGNYCFSIAVNILRNSEDAEECVNDTWVSNPRPPDTEAYFQMTTAGSSAVPVTAFRC